MRKQTKLVAVLSAAALLAVGASMTSFAGWEKDEDGIWHYYDSDDEMVTGEWAKDGSKWFYLDDDGNMATDTWVDDEYYVGSDGAMLKNAWIKTTPDEDIADPEDDGDAWYYFDSKGKKVTDEDKKINGKTYFFDEDGKMRDGWYEDENQDVYYLGGEDEGWRAENQWLWLELPDEEDEITNCDGDCDLCDEEGWYYFGSNGKMYKNAEKKKVNGKYYYFNEHGQMLYEWINNVRKRVDATPGNAQADGNWKGTASDAAQDMLYMNVVEEGWRADGWYEIDGSEDTKTDNDTDWYFFDDGEAEKADMSKDSVGLPGSEQKYRMKKKISASGSKYFCFNEYGQMQTGLQFVKDGFYYFDENGYMKTGKVSNVEEDNDSFTYYFNTSNGKNGQGVTGEKSGYLYFEGKRLEADDDYRLYYVKGDVYLVNTSGKIQSSKTKKYFIEGLDAEYKVQFGSGDKVVALTLVEDDKEGKPVELADKDGKWTTDAEDMFKENHITLPEIELYDDYKYTYVEEDVIKDTAEVAPVWVPIN